MSFTHTSWNILSKSTRNGIFVGLTENGQNIVLAAWSSDPKNVNGLVEKVHHIRNYGVVSNDPETTALIAEGFLTERSHYFSAHGVFPQDTPSVSAGTYWSRCGPVVTFSLVFKHLLSHDRHFFEKNLVAGEGYGVRWFDDDLPAHNFADEMVPLSDPVLGKSLEEVTAFFRHQLGTAIIAVELLPKE